MADIKPIFDQPPATEAMPTPYADVRYSPGAFGAGAGEGLQQAASGLTDLYKKAKDAGDAANVVQAEAELGNRVNARLYDPRAGFIAKRGHDAMAAYPDVVAGLASDRSEILDSLANDDQKRVFLARSNDTLLKAQRHAMMHEDQQGQQANTDAFKAREATS